MITVIHAGRSTSIKVNNYWDRSMGPNPKRMSWEKERPWPPTMIHGSPYSQGDGWRWYGGANNTNYNLQQQWLGTQKKQVPTVSKKVKHMLGGQSHENRFISLQEQPPEVNNDLPVSRHTLPQGRTPGPASGLPQGMPTGSSLQPGPLTSHQGPTPAIRDPTCLVPNNTHVVLRLSQQPHRPSSHGLLQDNQAPEPSCVEVRSTSSNVIRRNQESTACVFHHPTSTSEV